MRVDKLDENLKIAIPKYYCGLEAEVDKGTLAYEAKNKKAAPYGNAAIRPKKRSEDYLKTLAKSNNFSIFQKTSRKSDFPADFATKNPRKFENFCLNTFFDSILPSPKANAS